MLSKYPWAADKIEDAITNPSRFSRIKKKRLEQLLTSDRFLDAFSTQASNMSFEEQKKLRKVLIEPADGEETDYESDSESIVSRD